jgi:hypothetical protein
LLGGVGFDLGGGVFVMNYQPFRELLEGASQELLSTALEHGPQPPAVSYWPQAQCGKSSSSSSFPLSFHAATRHVFLGSEDTRCYLMRRDFVAFGFLDFVSLIS